MKKVVSAALASAMALMMGVNAFADVSFSSTSTTNADWPVEFGFGGNLVVMGDQVEQVALENGASIDVHPGNTIYMPLYHTPRSVEADTPDSQPQEEQVQYTGKIDKNWKINLVEKSKRFVDTAEFYRAKETDTGLTEEALYVKLSMTEELDSVKEEPIHYGLYLSEKGAQNKTKQVYVKGKFSNQKAENPIDFDWTNQVYGPSVWEVAEDQDGTAVFHFNDEASFTVRMFSGDSVLLNLSRSYNKEILSKYDRDMEFYNFKGNNDTFSATGTLSIPAGPDQYAYEIVNGNLREIPYTYNELDEAIEIKTKTLGSYVITDSRLEALPAGEQPEQEVEHGVVNGNSGYRPGNHGVKPNPSTGASANLAGAALAAVLSLTGAAALLNRKR